MMHVDDLASIKGRGRVAYVVLDGDAPAIRSKLRRVSDGAIYEVRGIERHARPPAKGDKVGLLLAGGGDLQMGDELEQVAQ